MVTVGIKQDVGHARAEQVEQGVANDADRAPLCGELFAQVAQQTDADVAGKTAHVRQGAANDGQV